MESLAFWKSPGTGPEIVAICPIVMVVGVTPIVSLAALAVVPEGWATVVGDVS